MAVTPALAQERPVLTVYTYDGFAAEWGPGPGIETGFEATCGCDLVFVGLDSSIGAFNRLRLEGASASADILLGLDANLMAEAEATGLFAPHGLDLGGLKLPGGWSNPVFAPFDWGYFAFVYDSTKLPVPPTSFQALIDAPDTLKIAIQDPRSATPGLGLLTWVRAAYGDEAPAIWAGLAPHILTVTKEWAESYDLFLKGEADMVLSYTTSPAYHAVAEGTTHIKAAPFSEGHYLQIELAAVTKGSKHPELARAFLAYLTGPGGQAGIPTTNWMFPVAEVAVPPAFGDLITPAKTLALDPADIATHRGAWIGEWQTALGR